MKRTAPRALLLLGVIALVVGPSLSYGRWYATKGPLEALAWVEQHRSERDSAVYASALYHASHARAVRESQWSPTGYGTQGVLLSVIGLGLVVVSRRRHARDTLQVSGS